MADNVAVLNAAGGTETLRATDVAGVKTPHHIVKRRPFDVTATLTVTNGAPAVGHCASAIINWPDVASIAGGSGVINTIIINGVVPVAYDLWLFNAATATSYAKDEAFILTAADALKNVGTISILAANYVGDHGSIFYAATFRNVGLQFTADAADTDLYGFLVNTGTTSPGTTTIYVRLVGEQLN